MERTVICEGKFVFGYNTISLPVFLSDIPNKIIFEHNDFFVNDFLHISLVCIGKIIEKYNVSVSNFEDKIINDFCEFSQNNEVKLMEYSNDFKFVQKDDKKTIVVMC